MAKKCTTDAKAKNIDLDGYVIYTPDKRYTDICTEFLKTTHIDVFTSSGYMALLNYIYQHTPKVNIEDVKELDKRFSIFTYVAAGCRCIPTLINYCTMVGISYNTLMNWRRSENRSKTHKQFCEKWSEFCKGAAINEAARGSIGAMYICKAVHGLVEQASQQPITQNNLYINAPMSREKIAQEFGISMKDHKI